MAELLQSLKEVQAYLTSQKMVLKKAGSLAACMDQQCTAWEAKLKTAKITASDAEDLLQVLAKGPWTESQAELIGTAINQAVLGQHCKGCEAWKEASTNDDNLPVLPHQEGHGRSLIHAHPNGGEDRAIGIEVCPVGADVAQ